MKTIGIGIGALQAAGVGLGMLELTSCGGTTAPPPPVPPRIVSWPIARPAYTTAQRQVCPVPIPPAAPHLAPGDVSLYAKYGYSAWNIGVPLQHIVRKDLAPGYTGARNVARLLYYFSMSDIHIADKESPSQPLYIGWNAPYGPSSSGQSSAYSPILLSTPQVLDAAVQTINALHQAMPFDFGMSLGDACNNTQYNELRWFLDTIDGKVITPSSGAHLGATTIDYQMPFYAAGISRDLPWYQVMGNHDQFWMGCAFEDPKTQHAHIGNTVIDIGNNGDPPPVSIQQTGAYMGVLDGTTPYGELIKAGVDADFDTAPTVVADATRHSLATSTSTTLAWMQEFFHTTSNPVGHGFTQANLDQDSACYSFVPKSDIPIKFIVLDDTVKGPDQADYAAGALDDERFHWLVTELDAGQAANQLMVIAAHVPILPQNSLTDTTPFPMWPGPEYTDDYVLNTLHQYPNLILWMAGHRHVNVVTPQPDPHGDPTLAFWEAETCSLRDHPQQFRTFDIRRNRDNTVSIIITNVDPAVQAGSPAYKSRGYALGAFRIFGATPAIIADTTSHSYNAELVVQLTPVMQSVISQAGSAIR
ncbi:MAG: TIGR03768 family metallophosphoesterase [Candidatus Korobacteraceae bacterium]